MLRHVPVFVSTSGIADRGLGNTHVEQDFLCTFFVHKRSFFIHKNYLTYQQKEDESVMRKEWDLYERNLSAWER